MDNPRSEKQIQAMQAAGVVAARFGMERIDPVILKDSNNISIHLAPFPVVARVSPMVIDANAAAKLAREVAVAQHLARADAPIVLPSTDPPAGPHFYESHGLTLWQFVNHRPADDSDSGMAALALRRIHTALENFTGVLPPFTQAIDGCHDLLKNGLEMRALTPVDRVFLLSAHDRLRARLASFSLACVALHGDSHLGNVLVTPNGLRWTDFESACMGPHEWDLTCLPRTSLIAFPEADQDLYAVLDDLRSLCVAVWCWVEPDRSPEKREAAEYHLRHLRHRMGAD
jgi:hypothetical protein